MKFSQIQIFILILLLSRAWLYPQSNDLIGKDFRGAMAHYQNALLSSGDVTKIPRTIDDRGKVQTVSMTDWTSGFFAGNLWQLYEYSKDTALLTAARKWTDYLTPLQNFNGHHDVGFMLYSSFGKGYQLTGDSSYCTVLLNGAKALSSRYNPKVGCIKSWNSRMAWDNKTLWRYPVIIDNMMNLELLFFASKKSGDAYYRNIAIKHALHTLKNHYRKDYSCYHVVDYDSATGKVLHRATCQGYSDESSWSRGQAWGLYGFTMCYRETKIKKFLLMAKHIARYIMNHPSLPSDKIPYWDYHVNQRGYNPQFGYNPSKYPDIVRDASAAAITASALYELSLYCSDGKQYKRFADSIIVALSSPEYTAAAGSNGNFILKHCTGSFPHGTEIDKPLVYADYYFLEALLRKQKIEKHALLFME